MEERKAKGELLYELDTLRVRVAKHEQAEHKGIDGELRELRQWFRKIFDNVAEGVLLVNLENKRLVTGNKTICQMLCYNAEDIANLEMTSICPPEDLYHFIEQFEKQANGELVFRKDIPIRRKDGNHFYADIFSVPLTFAGRIYMMCFFRETSSRKVESILQESTSLDSYASQLLSATEMKILRSIIKGMSNKEIATFFHRSIRTIENHRAHIMKKLNVDSSIELVKRAITMGLVDLSGEQRR